MVAALEVGQEVVLQARHVSVAMVGDELDLAPVDRVLEAGQAARVVAVGVGHDHLPDRARRVFLDEAHLLLVLREGGPRIDEDRSLARVDEEEGALPLDPIDEIVHRNGRSAHRLQVVDTDVDVFLHLLGGRRGREQQPAQRDRNERANPHRDLQEADRFPPDGAA